MLGSDAIVIATILFLLLSAVVLVLMLYTMKQGVIKAEEKAGAYDRRLAEIARIQEEIEHIQEKLARLSEESTSSQGKEDNSGTENSSPQTE